jgi:hypothetical protein
VCVDGRVVLCEGADVLVLDPPRQQWSVTRCAEADGLVPSFDGIHRILGRHAARDGEAWTPPGAPPRAFWTHPTVLDDGRVAFVLGARDEAALLACDHLGLLDPSTLRWELVPVPGDLSGIVCDGRGPSLAPTPHGLAVPATVGGEDRILWLRASGEWSTGAVVPGLRPVIAFRDDRLVVLTDAGWRWADPPQ